MRNFVIGCIVLFTLAGTACTRIPSHPSRRSRSHIGEKTQGR